MAFGDDLKAPLLIAGLPGDTEQAVDALRLSRRLSTTMTKQTIPDTDGLSLRRPLRLWPGVVIVTLQLLLRYLVPVIAPDASVFGASLVMIGMLAGVFGGPVVLVWWLFFSRAPWSERIGAVVLMVVALAATYRVVHPSIAGGMMGMMLPLNAIPVLSFALVAWAVATRNLSNRLRRGTMVASILFACGVFMLLRTGGISGVGSEFHWRWTPTPEQRLLAQVDELPTPPPVPPAVDIPSKPPAAKVDDEGSAHTSAAPKVAEPVAAKPAKAGTPTSLPARTKAEWPGFRGPNRDSVIPGVRIDTDWSKSPPVEMWRPAVGPGWSSFAGQGDLIYTQDQR